MGKPSKSEITQNEAAMDPNKGKKVATPTATTAGKKDSVGKRAPYGRRANNGKFGAKAYGKPVPQGAGTGRKRNKGAKTKKNRTLHYPAVLYKP